MFQSGVHRTKLKTQTDQESTHHLFRRPLHHLVSHCLHPLVLMSMETQQSPLHSEVDPLLVLVMDVDVLVHSGPPDSTLSLRLQWNMEAGQVTLDKREVYKSCISLRE